MFISLLFTLISGLITGLIYAYLFLAATHAALVQQNAHAMRKKSIITAISRFLIIAVVFWYLLRLPVSDRILFLGALVSSFWAFIIIAQRRYYGRN